MLARPCSAVLLALPLATFAACEAVPALDTPSHQAIKAEALTFEAVAPALCTFIAADLGRPIAERVPPPERTPPAGRSDAELAGMLGLLDNWRWRLNATANAAGLDLEVELPPVYEVALGAARPVPSTEVGQ